MTTQEQLQEMLSDDAEALDRAGKKPKKKEKKQKGRKRNKEHAEAKQKGLMSIEDTQENFDVGEKVSQEPVLVEEKSEETEREEKKVIPDSRVNSKDISRLMKGLFGENVFKEVQEDERKREQRKEKAESKEVQAQSKASLKLIQIIKEIEVLTEGNLKNKKLFDIAKQVSKSTNFSSKSSIQNKLFKKLQDIKEKMITSEIAVETSELNKSQPKIETGHLEPGPIQINEPDLSPEAQKTILMTEIGDFLVKHNDAPEKLLAVLKEQEGKFEWDEQPDVFHLLQKEQNIIRQKLKQEGKEAEAKEKIKIKVQEEQGPERTDVEDALIQSGYDPAGALIDLSSQNDDESIELNEKPEFLEEASEDLFLRPNKKINASFVKADLRREGRDSQKELIKNVLKKIGAGVLAEDFKEMIVCSIVEGEVRINEDSYSKINKYLDSLAINITQHEKDELVLELEDKLTAALDAEALKEFSRLKYHTKTIATGLGIGAVAALVTTGARMTGGSVISSVAGLVSGTVLGASVGAMRGKVRQWLNPTLEKVKKNNFKKLTNIKRHKAKDVLTDNAIETTIAQVIRGFALNKVTGAKEDDFYDNAKELLENISDFSETEIKAMAKAVEALARVQSINNKKLNSLVGEKTKNIDATKKGVIIGATIGAAADVARAFSDSEFMPSMAAGAIGGIMIGHSLDNYIKKKDRIKIEKKIKIEVEVMKNQSSIGAPQIAYLQAVLKSNILEPKSLLQEEIKYILINNLLESKAVAEGLSEKNLVELNKEARPSKLKTAMAYAAGVSIGAMTGKFFASMASEGLSSLQADSVSSNFKQDVVENIIQPSSSEVIIQEKSDIETATVEELLKKPVVSAGPVIIDEQVPDRQAVVAEKEISKVQQKLLELENERLTPKIKRTILQREDDLSKTLPQLEYVLKSDHVTGMGGGQDNLKNAILENVKNTGDIKQALATVYKGEGVEHVLRRQLEASPEDYGFEGDADDYKEVHAWSGKQAHRIALETNNLEAVKRPDKFSYVLSKENDGTIHVTKFIKNDGIYVDMGDIPRTSKLELTGVSQPAEELIVEEVPKNNSSEQAFQEDRILGTKNELDVVDLSEQGGSDLGGGMIDVPPVQENIKAAPVVSKKIDNIKIDQGPVVKESIVTKSEGDSREALEYQKNQEAVVINQETGNIVKKNINGYNFEVDKKIPESKFKVLEIKNSGEIIIQKGGVKVKLVPVLSEKGFFEVVNSDGQKHIAVHINSKGVEFGKSYRALDIYIDGKNNVPDTQKDKFNEFMKKNGNVLKKDRDFGFYRSLSKVIKG